MKRICGHVVLLAAMTTPAFAGNLTFLTSPLTPLDTFNWSNIGGDGTTFGNNTSVTSALGNQVGIGLGTQPALGGLTSVVCAAVPVGNCSWAHQPSGYADGDTLIWLEGLDTNGNPVGTGPVTFTLQNAVGGLGTYLQATSAGAFSATLTVFHGGSVLGSRSFSSDVAGDPLFVGAADNLPSDITSAVVAVTSCGSFDCDDNDFSVDTLQTFAPVPEPPTFALGGSLLALGISLARLRKGK